jgi:RNA 2',3'-cyclic 3'-phosphodiesterase
VSAGDGAAAHRHGARPESAAIRWFIALAVPEAVRRPLERATSHLRAVGAELRPTPPVGWHVTLAFLGEVDRAQAAVAREVLSATLTSAAPRPAPRLAVRRAGRFGDRVLLVHLNDDPEGALTGFVSTLHRDLRAAGLEVPDRAFEAHLTLARARRSRRVTAADVAALRLPSLRWRPEAVEIWATAVPRDDRPYVVESVLPWPAPP